MLLITLLGLSSALLVKSEFVCPSSGFFPNPEDCASFYSCTLDLKPILTFCGPGTLFDPVAKLCDLAENVQCEATTNSPTSTSSSGTTTETTTVGSTLSTTTEGNGPKCPANGSHYIENSEDCTSYYKCVNGDLTLLECPPGFAYDTLEEKCSVAEEVGCNIGIMTTTEYPNSVTCPSDGVHPVPNPVDCGTFYICVNGKPSLITCPIGYEYDLGTERCEKEGIADCNGSGSTTGSPTPTTTFSSTSTTSGPIEDCSGQPNGALLPHPTDCSLFIECFSGVAHVNNCPPGLEFNVAVHACDRPENANCENSFGRPY